MSVRFGDGDVILEIRPSLFRRGISLLAIAAVVVLLMRAALFEPELDPFVRAFIIALSAGAAILAVSFYRATEVGLELTKDQLRDTNGRVLFDLDQIERVDRGLFALKPSNGMSVYLKTPASFVWQPGLWWRFGRRIGIGGATAPAQAKAIVEALTLLQASEDG